MKPLITLTAGLVVASAMLAFVQTSPTADESASPPVAPAAASPAAQTASVGVPACAPYTCFYPNCAPTSEFDAFLRVREEVILCLTHSMDEIRGPSRDYSSMSVMAVVAFHPGAEAQKVRGIQITVTRVHEFGPVEFGGCNLSVEQAESLSKALLFFSQSSGTMGKRRDTANGSSVTYTTAGGMQVSQERITGEYPASVTVGLGTLLPVTIAFRNTAAMATLKRELDEGIGWLKSQ